MIIHDKNEMRSIKIRIPINDPARVIKNINLSQDEYDSILNAIKNANNYEYPDGYYIKNGQIYIFEMFNVDYSNGPNKGSGLCQFYGSRKIQTHQIEIESREAIVSKFLEPIKKHYKQIDGYKKGLLEKSGLEDARFKIVFVATSVMFPIYVLGEQKEFIPFFIEQIRDELVKMREIDYFLYFNGTEIRDTGFIIKNDGNYETYSKGISLGYNKIYDKIPII